MYSLDVDVVSFLLAETDPIEERLCGLEAYIISTLDLVGVNRRHKFICGLDSTTCKNRPGPVNDLISECIFEIPDGTRRVTCNLTGPRKVPVVFKESFEEVLLLVVEFTLLVLLLEKIHRVPLEGYCSLISPCVLAPLALFNTLSFAFLPACRASLVAVLVLPRAPTP